MDALVSLTKSSYAWLSLVATIQAPCVAQDVINIWIEEEVRNLLVLRKNGVDLWIEVENVVSAEPRSRGHAATQ